MVEIKRIALFFGQNTPTRETNPLLSRSPVCYHYTTGLYTRHIINSSVLPIGQYAKCLHNWTCTSNIKIISLNLLYVPILFLILLIITRCRKIYLYKPKNYNILFSIYLLYASLNGWDGEIRTHGLVVPSDAVWPLAYIPIYETRKNIKQKLKVSNMF